MNEQETDEVIIRAEPNIGSGRQKCDDIIAMQAVVCILAAIGTAIFGMVDPERCGALLEHFKRIVISGADVIPNPIDLLGKF